MTKYERHIRKLCRKHDIFIVRVDRQYAANSLSKKIWIRKTIKSIKSYIFALHEIGHVINENRKINMFKEKWTLTRGKKKGGYVTKYMLQNEIDAWKTAVKLSKWWNSTAEKAAVESLLSYIIVFNRCHKKPFILDNRKLRPIFFNLMDDKFVVMLLAGMTYRKA